MNTGSYSNMAVAAMAAEHLEDLLTLASNGYFLPIRRLVTIKRSLPSWSFIST